MTWFERHFGIDGVDAAIQVAVTGIGVIIVDRVFGRLFGSTVDLVLSLKVVGLSLLVFGWRRHRAFKRRAAQPAGLTSDQMAAERLAEVEQRLADLEQTQQRVLDLEERLDFTERLLARSSDERALIERGG